MRLEEIITTKCMEILNSVMKLIVKYLLRDFDNHKLVLKNHKSMELKATFLMKENSFLRKKIKKGSIAADDLNITISYTE